MRSSLLTLLLSSFLLLQCKPVSSNKVTTFKSDSPLTLQMYNVKDIGILDVYETTINLTDSNHLNYSDTVQNNSFVYLMEDNILLVYFNNKFTDDEIYIKQNEDGTMKINFESDDSANELVSDFHTKVINYKPQKEDAENIVKDLLQIKDLYLEKLELISLPIKSPTYKSLKGMIIGKTYHLISIYLENIPEINYTHEAYQCFEQMDLNNEYFLSYPDNINIVHTYINWAYYQEFQKELKTNKDFIKTAIKHIEDKHVLEQITSAFISMQIPKISVDEKSKLISLLKEASIAHKYLKFLEETPAASAPGSFLNGKMELLEDLKPYKETYNLNLLYKNKVFLDHWATWCGPCVKAIKNFKEKAGQIPSAPKLNIVMVSFDRTEKQWRNFILKNDLDQDNIYHLYHGMNYETAYAKYYAIQSLPSYLMVNNQNIIDLNPPSPSDSTFVNYFKEK